MSMSAHFATYAAAFEEAFVSDDWSRVEPFFTEDAVYEINLDPPMGGRFEGRAAILAYFKEVLDGFDRRFDSREVALIDGPKEDRDSVWVLGRATYRANGVPDLVFDLEEIAYFEGDRIRRLEDRYDKETEQRVATYMAEYGGKLGISSDG